jgi:hypothetical protein
VYRRSVAWIRDTSGQRLFRIVVCLVLLDALMEWHSVPRPLPESAPAGAFSALRAIAQLRTLVGNNVPHPVGSTEDVRIRGLLVQRLQALQIPVEVHDGYGCSAHDSSCAPVHNVVARIPGLNEGKAVLLVVHYDSVPAGPGAADDGSGVAAALEVARALKAGPALPHPVLLLFNEGEEAGLLGAEAFAASDPWMREVGAVVNADARGTSGPSRLFETSGPTRWLARRVVRALPHPSSASLFTSIYERLPNGTDLTVFKRRGIPGVNLAFIGDPLRYHTPDDTVDHLSLATLQHQGEGMLATVRAFAGTDFEQPPPGNAVFFDVGELFVVEWPERWALPLAILAAALIGFVLFRTRPRPSITTLLVRIVAILAATGASLIITRLLVRAETWAGALPNPWVAFSPPLVALAVLVPCAVGAAALWFLDLFVDPTTDWLSCWFLWAIHGIVAAIMLPGASYIFVAPTLVAGIVGLILLPFGWWLPAMIIPSFVAAMVVFPLLSGFYSALGTVALPGDAVLIMLLLVTLLPLIVAFDRPRLSEVFRGALLLLCLVLFTIAAIPPVSAGAPGPLTLQLLVDGESGQARWMALTAEKDLPEPLAQAAGFVPLRPDSSAPPVGEGFGANAGRYWLPQPEVEIRENTLVAPGVRRLVLHLASPRQAQVIAVMHGGEGRVESGTLRVPQWPSDLHYNQTGWATHTFWSVPPEGIEVELTLPANDKTLIVRDLSFGLPPIAAPLLNARPVSLVPIRRGDGVIVSRTLLLSR